jgi:hypothetical protein
MNMLRFEFGVIFMKPEGEQMECGIVFLMNVAVSACETVARYLKFEAICDQFVQRFLFERISNALKAIEVESTLEILQ